MSFILIHSLILFLIIKYLKAFNSIHIGINIIERYDFRTFITSFQFGNYFHIWESKAN